MRLLTWSITLTLSLFQCTSTSSNDGGGGDGNGNPPPTFEVSLNKPPVVQNVRTTVNTSSGVMTITYNVSDAENEMTDVQIFVVRSDDSRYEIPTTQLTGDSGYPVNPGENKQIQWTYSSDPEYDSLKGTSIRIEVVADDRFVFDLEDVIALVDRDRILNDLETMEGVRHTTANKSNNEKTRTYLRSNFSSYGVEYIDQPFPHAGEEGINIIGTITGTASSNAFYIIDGHYDTVTTSPGVDDNASGTAGMLEAMRVLSQFNFEIGIKFIGFDLEERGLRGSRYYARNKPANEDIRGLINLEMIGFTCRGEANCRDFPNADTSIYNISSSFSNELSNEFVSIGTEFVPALRIASTSDNGDPNFRRSDHAPFWDIGVDALFITDGANFRTPHYHRSTDVVEHIDLDFATNIVKTSVGTLAKLAGYSHKGVEISESLTLE